jgi:hypothetical protein
MGKLENAGDMSRRTLEVSSSGLKHPTSVYWTAFDWGSKVSVPLEAFPGAISDVLAVWVESRARNPLPTGSQTIRQHLHAAQTVRP